MTRGARRLNRQPLPRRGSDMLPIMRRPLQGDKGTRGGAAQR